MIVPATSKGTGGAGDVEFNEADLLGLPLYTALLSSLYNTCEPEFRYTVYLSVNEGASHPHIYERERTRS